MDFPKKYRDNVLNAERSKEEISIQNRFETAMEKVQRENNDRISRQQGMVQVRIDALRAEASPSRSRFSWILGIAGFIVGFFVCSGVVDGPHMASILYAPILWLGITIGSYAAGTAIDDAYKNKASSELKIAQHQYCSIRSTENLMAGTDAFKVKRDQEMAQCAAKYDNLLMQYAKAFYAQANSLVNSQLGKGNPVFAENIKKLGRKLGNYLVLDVRQIYDTLQQGVGINDSNTAEISAKIVLIIYSNRFELRNTEEEMRESNHMPRPRYEDPFITAGLADAGSDDETLARAVALARITKNYLMGLPTRAFDASGTREYDRRIKVSGDDEKDYALVKITYSATNRKYTPPAQPVRPQL